MPVSESLEEQHGQDVVSELTVLTDSSYAKPVLGENKSSSSLSTSSTDASTDDDFSPYVASDLSVVPYQFHNIAVVDDDSVSDLGDNLGNTSYADSIITLDPNEFEIEGPTSDGVNGVWILKDKMGNRWVFKPTSEEAFRQKEEESKSRDVIIYDPSQRTPLRNGILWGSTTKKEIAAYLIDHGFAGVPRTLPARAWMPSIPHGSRWTKPKQGELVQSILQIGSLQEFRENISSAEDMSSSRFSVDQVHKIGILDIRLQNLDRHLGNILVSKNSDDAYQLTPIDHGYSLPDFRSCSDVMFEWLYWKQCKQPFSKTSLDFIKSLDPWADSIRLANIGIRQEEVLTCLLSTILLQKAASKGLSLFEIGSLVQRADFGDDPSAFELIVDEAMKAVPVNQQPHVYIDPDSPELSPPRLSMVLSDTDPGSMPPLELDNGGNTPTKEAHTPTKYITSPTISPATPPSKINPLSPTMSPVSPLDNYIDAICRALPSSPQFGSAESTPPSSPEVTSTALIVAPQQPKDVAGVDEESSGTSAPHTEMPSINLMDRIWLERFVTEVAKLMDVEVEKVSSQR